MENAESLTEEQLNAIDKRLFALRDGERVSSQIGDLALVITYPDQEAEEVKSFIYAYFLRLSAYVSVDVNGFISVSHADAEMSRAIDSVRASMPKNTTRD